MTEEIADPALRHQAHTLIDAINPAQLTAIVGLLQVIAPHPSAHSQVFPFEDEFISEEENAQAAAGAEGPWTPLDQVMIQLNITQADLDEQRMRDEAVVSR